MMPKRDHPITLRLSPGGITQPTVGETELRRPWSPWRHLRTRFRDVRVYELELDGDLLGCVDLDRRLIWLDSRLTQAEQRSTLAHELGHLERGSICSPGAQTAEERAVEEWAAVRLIDAHALARALQWSCRVEEIADELWVDEHLVRARFRALTDEEQDLLLAAIEKTRVA